MLQRIRTQQLRPIARILSQPAFIQERWMSHKLHLKDSLEQRTLDRHHRSIYNQLDRIQRKYQNKDTKIKLSPTIDHLIIYYRSLLNDNSIRYEFKPNASLSSKPKPQELVEPLFFHSIICLSGIQIPKQTQKAHIKAINHCIKQSGIPTRSVNTEQVIALIQNIQTEYECNHSIDHEEFQEILSNLLSILSTHSLSDISQFIKSIISSNVRPACDSLCHISNIPNCIIADIINRSPLSKEEFYLQLELWMNYQSNLSYFYNNNSLRLKNCFNSLLYYATHYDAFKLPSIIESTLETFKKTQKKNSNLLSNSFLNSLIWDVAYFCKATNVSKPHQIASKISRSQEIVVQYFKKYNTDKKPYEFLSLKGFSGIALGIKLVSPKKAELIFERASNKFSPQLNGQDPNNDDEELIAYFCTYISLSNNPDILMFRFNECAQFWSHSGKIWGALIDKLIEFEILSEKRSVKLLQHMLDRKDKLFVTKQNILLLLKGIRSLVGLDHFLEHINSLDSGIYHCIRNAAFPKYLRLLYQRARSEEFRKFDPESSGNFYKNLEAVYPTNEKKALQKARSLYKNWNHKTESLVGIYLNGESIFNAVEIYDMYQKEVGTPTEDSIVALIKASTSGLETNNKTAKISECLIWGELYAPQVAIHEFYTNVMHSNYNDNNYGDENLMKLYPSENLWRVYINMLVKFEYVSELSEIMPWWERLGYLPSAELLLQLLMGLPQAIAERHILHIQKVRETNNLGEEFAKQSLPHTITRDEWPWPSIQDYKVEKNNSM